MMDGMLIGWIGIATRYMNGEFQTFGIRSQGLPAGMRIDGTDFGRQETEPKPSLVASARAGESEV